MISINIENICQKLSLKESFIDKCLKKIHSRNQGFYTDIDNNRPIKKINAFAKKVEKKYDHIVVLGIGGSALGTATLAKALGNKKSPKFYILDNIDPTFIKETEEQLNLRKTLFIVVTKSGSTVETNMLYFYFRKKIEEKKLKIKDHFTIVTSQKKGLLIDTAKKENIPTFEIPKNIGGRFSVLTPAALLPAKLIGINIEKLLTGARIIRNSFLSKNSKKNLPFLLASVQYALEQKGKNINIIMPYSNKLTALSLWYCQLIAESLGKNGKGITPIPALGASDQHSQLQLFQDGPKDKLIIFLEIENSKPTLVIPNPYPKNKELNFLKELTFNKLLKIEKSSTEKSLAKNNRPSITIKVDFLSEESMGELIMLFETSIAFLGEFYGINAYNQPGVEASKSLTKKALIK